MARFWPSYVVIVVGPIGVNPIRIVLLCLLIIWSISFFLFGNLQRHIRIIYKQNKVLILLITAFFLQGIVAAILGSANKSVSLSAAILQILYFPVFMLFAVSYIRSLRHVVIFSVVVMISLFIAEAIALLEVAMNGSFFAQYVDAASKTAEQILEGKVRDGRYRVTSTFSNPLSFAEFMVLLYPICFYVVRQVKKRLYRNLAASQIVLIPICMWFTGSRAGLGLLVLSLVWILWLQSGQVIRAQRVLLVSLVICATLILGIILELDRILIDILLGTGGAEGSSYARLLQLMYGIPAVFSSPLYGYGIHQGAEQIPYLNAIDNYYLTVALEKGLVGLILLLFLQKRMIRLLKKAYSSDAGHRAWQSIFQYLIISFVMVFIFELIVSITEVYSIMYVLLGITMVMISLMDLQKRIKHAM